MSYKALGNSKALKMHMLDYLDFFSAILGAVNDEQVVMFHQDIFLIEKCYQSKWSLLAD